MYRSNVHTLQYLDTAGSEPACEHRLPPGVLVVGDGRANATGPLLADTHAEGRHPLPLQLSQRNFVRGSCGRLTGCMTWPSSERLRACLCLDGRIFRQAPKSPSLVFKWAWKSWGTITEGRLCLR